MAEYEPLERRVDNLEQSMAKLLEQTKLIGTVLKICVGMLSPTAFEAVRHIITPTPPAIERPAYLPPPPIPADPSLPPEYRR